MDDTDTSGTLAEGGPIWPAEPGGAVTDDELDGAVRKVLADHAKLAVDALRLDPEADTYRAGMTSHASVNVMLALEDTFDVEFPESMLNKRTFASVSAITQAVAELTRTA